MTDTPKLDLADDARALLLAERTAEAARLRASADAVENMTLDAYLARGLRLDDIESLGLIGRLAKRGWSHVWWSVHDGGWYAARGEFGSCEGPVDATDVERTLNATKSKEIAREA